MKDKHRNLRKAAVLVASLDAERAEAILAQMSPAQAQAVCEAVAQLGTPDPLEQQQVIEEFFRIGPLVPDRDASGIALDDPACQSQLVDRGPSLDERPGDIPGDQCVRQVLCVFEQAPTSAVASFLGREQPQTIAVVVSRLPAASAAQVLAALPPESQVEVARRLVDLDEADPDIIHDIARAFTAWLDEQTRDERRRAAGMAALGSILEAANPADRKRLLANLRREAGPSPGGVAPDRELPAAPTPFAFGELDQLDSPALAMVLEQANLEVLVLALAGAKTEFAERALALSSPARSQVLRRAVCNLGPTRLSDIEEAQLELAHVAGQLERRGAIVRGQARHLSVAV
jgi:flagellar motor switch protein FliG